ncbi:MAG: DsrE/DsrF/TusD sulfur relay family protein [Candidatus Heimdallarchaeota archaeon]
MDPITIIINDAPYGAERPWNALRLALTLTSTTIKSKVNVFLLGDAVFLAKKGQRPPEGYYNLEKMLTDLIRKDGNVRACGTCLRVRGLNQDDLVEGVKIGTMMELTKWTTESRGVLSF